MNGREELTPADTLIEACNDRIERQRNDLETARRRLSDLKAECESLYFDKPCCQDDELED